MSRKKQRRTNMTGGKPTAEAVRAPTGNANEAIAAASTEKDRIEGQKLDAERREDIRGVLIAVENGRLLLPNASIAEVLSYADPDPVDNTPDWLLGRIRWRGWQLPLISFSQLVGLGNAEAGLGSKVVVLRALGGNPKFPYFAMLTGGFPRLVTVTHDGLIEDDPDGPLPAAVLAQVRLNEDSALLPDIMQLETLIGEALAEAA